MIKYALGGLAGCALMALAGCGEQPGPATPSVADSIPLYPISETHYEKIYIYIGQEIPITWTADVATSGLKLLYTNVETEAQTEISSEVTGTTYAWTVPTGLESETEYRLQAMADVGTSGTPEVVAASPPINITDPPDGSTNGIEPVACNSNGDCDDSLFCNGVEICTNGICSNGTPPCAEPLACYEAGDICMGSSCDVDGDCIDPLHCISQVCTIIDVGSNDLHSYATDGETGEEIDFSEPLVVGQAILLTAPSSSAGGTAKTTANSCSCAWQVDPTTAGSFDETNVCSTGFTIEEDGLLTFALTVVCNGTTNSFSQGGAAIQPPPPTSCTGDSDCDSDEVCSNGFCATAPTPAPSIEILEESPMAPFVVRFDMRLKDENGKIIPEGVTGENFIVYENGEFLDLTETNQFVTPAPNLPLRIVLVLDYTNSMAMASAIPSMISAAQSFVQAKHFTATHQIGIVEFHDRGDVDSGFSTSITLTDMDSNGKETIANAIPASGTLENGLTRVWDAIDLAITMLGEPERKTGEVQAIVFLTDGHDTTSELTSSELIEAATEANIKLYPIGFGNLGTNEAVLKLMASESGGAYFPATQASELHEVMSDIASDLRGQWNLSYITQRNSGTVNVSIEFTWDDSTVTHTTSFDAGQLAGDIHEGLIEVTDREYDEIEDETQFLLRADYIPRSIDRLGLVFAHSAAEFTLQGSGGLTDPAKGWSLTNVGEGEYLLFGFDMLEYGDFGNIGTVRIPGNVLELQLEYNDDIHSFLPQPKTFVFTGDYWDEPYRLNVIVTPEELGYVTISPDKSGYGEDEKVTLTAVPVGSNSSFDRWSGEVSSTDASITISMDEDKTVTATFKE